MKRAVTAWLVVAVSAAWWPARACRAQDAAGLMKQLSTGGPAAQREASNKLAQLGPAAVDLLAKALRHPDKRVRYHAALALKQIGKPAASALAALLAGNDAQAKYPAAYALADVRDTSLLPAWLAAAKNPDPRVRYYAVRALGHFKDPRAADAIRRALKDASPLVRGAAAGAAALMGDAGGIEGLAALMNPGVDADTRFKAAFALWKLRDLRAVPALARGMNDSVPRVRHHCAWALGDLKAKAAVMPLVNVLQNSSDNTLKYYAANSLKQITGQQFGFDAAKWREWLRRNKANESGGTR